MRRRGRQRDTPGTARRKRKKIQKSKEEHGAARGGANCPRCALAPIFCGLRHISYNGAIDRESLRGLAQGRDGNAGTVVFRVDEKAKAIDQRVKEKGNEPRFHSAEMISRFDPNGQLMFQNAHMLGVMGFVVIASCLDQDYRQTYPRGARPAWLGAKRAVQTCESRARHYPPNGGVRRAGKRADRDTGQDRRGA